MLSVPPHVLTVYLATLKERGVDPGLHASYRKWLRYYLDYCTKYRLEITSSDSPSRFLDKLRQKKQADWQVRQAAHAVSIYLEGVEAEPLAEESPAGQSIDEETRAKSRPSEPTLGEAIGRSFDSWAKSQSVEAGRSFRIQYLFFK